MSHEENASEVGSYLRSFRRSRQISLEEVSVKTKIRMVVLRQIESGDLNQMPSPTFAKGFLRAYAQAVGADVQEVLQRYETGCKIHFLQTQQNQDALKHPRGTYKWWLLVAVAIFAGLIAASLYLADRMRTKHPATGSVSVDMRETPLVPVEPAPLVDSSKVADEATADAPTSPVQPDRTETSLEINETEINSVTPGPDLPDAVLPDVTVPSALADENAAAEATSGRESNSRSSQFTLHLSAVELTWLKIVSDDGPAREMTMYPDDQMTLEARHQFNLLIGNAGGVRLKLNGKPVQVPGRSGKVVKLQLP